MKVIETALEGVVILEPELHRDARGYFFESYSQKLFDRSVRPVRFVQDNESRSSYGVLRGLQFQRGEHAQIKLVRVISGTVLDVAVDIRRGSPTFGRHVAVELSGENRRQLFIPRGFAHGFAVLSEEALFQYKCDNYYAPQSEGYRLADRPRERDPLGKGQPPSETGRSTRTVRLRQGLLRLTIKRLRGTAADTSPDKAATATKAAPATILRGYDGRRDTPRSRESLRCAAMPGAGTDW